ncbi:polymorphic toxin type 24 domain-containing protein [Nocardia sp. NPDC055053]
MTPTITRVEVDPKVYYQAATNCFDAAAALFDSFTYIFGELNSYGMMAGRDEDGRAWAASYDQSARDAVSFYGQTYQTLRAYGTALNDIGFEHAQSDANLRGTVQPERPADAASTATFGPYALPASAAGGTPQGLAGTAIDVLDAINCPLPDGNTDTLANAADAWDRLGRIYQNTNAKDKITIAASLFEGVVSEDATQVREDLKTIENSIGELLNLCNQLSKACTDYKDSIVELRNQINGFINDIVADAALDLAFTVVASCLAPGPGTMLAGAKAVASAKKWATTIGDAVKAWRARKIVQLAGVAENAKTTSKAAWKAVTDLFERLKTWIRTKLTPKPSLKNNLDNAAVCTDRILPTKGTPNSYMVKKDANGNVTHYTYFDEDGIATKRVDLTGKSHHDKETGQDIPTPHVVEVRKNQNPKTGEYFGQTLPNSVRAATPEEIP